MEEEEEEEENQSQEDSPPISDDRVCFYPETPDFTFEFWKKHLPNSSSDRDIHLKWHDTNQNKVVFKGHKTSEYI